MSRTGSVGFRVAASAILILVVAAFAAAFVSVRMWNDIVVDTESKLKDIASILSEQTFQSVKTLDLVLEDLVAEVSWNAIETEDEFRALTRSRALYDKVMSRFARLPQVVVISMIDADGHIVLSTRGWPAPDLDVSGLDPFEYLKATPDSGLVAGIPIRSRGSGDWTVYFSRRVETGTGEFLGTVGIGVPPEFFLRISDNVSAIEGLTAQLLRRDGTIYVTNPPVEESLGERAEQEPAWFDLVASGGGAFRSSGDRSGDGRFMAVMPLADYPLVVDVAVTEASVIGRWHGRILPIWAISLVLALCMMVLTGFLLIQFTRALEREAQLRERDERLARARRERELETARFEAALTHVRQGLAVFDRDNRLVTANQTFARMYGIAPEQVPPGTTFATILGLRVANGTSTGDDPEHYISRHLNSIDIVSEDFGELEELSDGRFIRTSRQPMPDGGWLTIDEDVTERELAVAHLKYLASHDPLTGLANRTLLIDTLANLQRTAGGAKAVGLLMVDLDRFKTVNDKFGHATGDALLKGVAARLTAGVGKRDIVARFGGDEFAILHFSDVTDPDALVAFGSTILAALQQPLTIDHHTLKVGASIGVASSADTSLSPDTLLSRADLALYRAKSNGRNRIVAFDAEMEVAISARRDLAADLETALDAAAIEVHFQPIVSAYTGTTLAMEALARWRHPRLGQITPAVFIPLAEETGQILRLGQLVLERACRSARNWPPEVRIAVNVSPIQVAQVDLPGLVRLQLAEAGLSPSRLEMEITESALLADDTRIKHTLDELRSTGIQIVLDDFGTGFASLSNLNNFAVDKIKIDRSFISQLGEHVGSTVIVEASTMIADAFGVVATAEGVETKEQCRLLRAIGVAQLQGYLFGAPAPAEAWRFENGKAVTVEGGSATRPG